MVFPALAPRQFLSFASHLLLKVIWNSTVVQWNVSAFYQSFLPPKKRVHSFNIAKPLLFSFHDFYNFFLESNIRKRDQVLRLLSHFILIHYNASCCSQKIIHICIARTWSNYRSHHCFFVVGMEVLRFAYYSVPAYFKYL